MRPEIDRPSPLRIVTDYGTVTTSFDSVRIADRSVPRQMKAVFPGGDDQPKLTMFIEVKDGVPRLMNLHIDAWDDGREVRAKDLKNLAKLDDWVELVVAHCSSRIVSQTDTETASVIDGDIAGAMRVVSRSRRGNRRAINDKLLTKVAEIYNAAERYGLDDVRAAFGVSRATADRYVRASREAGFIEKRKS